MMNPAVTDELEALQAIFTDEIAFSISGSQVRVHYQNDKFTIRFLLSELYPNQPPDVTVQLATRNVGMSEHITKSVRDLLKDRLGSVVMYEVLEFVSSEVSSICIKDSTEMPDDECHEDIPAFGFGDGIANTQLHSSSVHIVHGDPITDRGSTFQAHYMPVSSLEEVNEFRCALLEDRKVRYLEYVSNLNVITACVAQIARATHNIFAFRFTDSKTGICYHDCDDDGEAAAGAKLAEVLRLMGADGVAVVVTRWFGGTLLGSSYANKLLNILT